MLPARLQGSWRRESCRSGTQRFAPRGASWLQSRPRRSAQCRAEPCSTYLQPPKLTGQVQRSFLRLVDEAGVGLVLEQHL